MNDGGWSRVRAALAGIAQADPDGLIQPERVVEVARNHRSPLHAEFQWDDTEAAHEYRLEQARRLIRRVTIVRLPQRAPEFVNVTIRRPDGEVRRGYVATDRAVADPDLYQQVVGDARRGLVAYRNRLSAFERARGLVDMLDEVIGKAGVEAGQLGDPSGSNTIPANEPDGLDELDEEQE